MSSPMPEPIPFRIGQATEERLTDDGDARARADASVAAVFTEGLEIVTIDNFVGVDDLGAAALLGTPEEAVIAEGGDFMIYGEGGAGKTTLEIDLAFHLAAGDDWLGMRVPRPCRVLLIENEGPRAFFKRKLRHKRAVWKGSPVADRLMVLAVPWAQISVGEVEHRAVLAAAVKEAALDVVVIGPITAAGMDEAGTLQQTREYAAYCELVRRRSGRPVCFGLIHHTNRAGTVSGAWEGVGDTLLHVACEGHGRSRLFIQKARWASTWHRRTLRLAWTESAGFELIEVPERTDETIANEILASARKNGGESWAKVKEGIIGKAERIRKVRDELLASGHLLNSGTEHRSAYWSADDPARPEAATSRSRWDRVGTGHRDPSAETAQAPPGPRSPHIGDRVGADRLPERHEDDRDV